MGLKTGVDSDCGSIYQTSSLLALTQGLITEADMDKALINIYTIRMKAAIIDRNVANVENFKNHPSVIIWSLGNECGRVGSNFVAALNTVKAMDSTRFVHYERFGAGKNNPADLDGRMAAQP